MAQNLTLSGTLGCPACRLGTFQPGFLLVGPKCLCIGTYNTKTRTDCVRVGNKFICHSTTSLVSIAPAICNCNGKTYPAKSK